MAELTVVVVARASHETVGPWRNGELRVRVMPPAVEGAANRAVVRAVARAIRVAPSTIDLISGDKARRKRLRITGLEDAELGRRLARLGV